MKAVVVTTIVQELEVPEGTDKQAIFNFLAAQQSFRDPFVGLTDGDMTITDVEVLLDEVQQLGEEVYED